MCISTRGKPRGLHAGRRVRPPGKDPTAESQIQALWEIAWKSVGRCGRTWVKVVLRGKNRMCEDPEAVVLVPVSTC